MEVEVEVKRRRRYERYMLAELIPNCVENGSLCSDL
jgi:hypothetical protein